MGKKNAKAYIPENLEYFVKTLEGVRKRKDREKCYFRPNLANLQKAMESLPKEDRQNIEKFWGLTGGPNHSKKNPSVKDIAFAEMRKMAVESMGLLFRLDYVVIYDEYIKTRISQLIKKINKNGVQISDLDAIKYLLVFQVILLNGPKMCFETDPLAVDTGCNDNFEYEEYSVICEISRMLEVLPDNSINIKLLIDWVDMINFKDSLAIKKTFGLAISKDDKKEEIEILKTFSQVRRFKTRVFTCGSWDLTSLLILGNPNGEVNLEGFMTELNRIRKDWSRIEEFKNGQITLKTIDGIRHLNVYNIGELEFYDPDEVIFLYLERNLIESLIPDT